MSARNQEPPNEWGRLSAVKSLANVIALYVDHLEQLPVDRLPAWLMRITPPIGWHIGRFEDGRSAPSRIAVHGNEDPGGGYGCETINIFRLSDMPPIQAVTDNADCTLQDLRATGIATKILPLPHESGVMGVRSSGYVDIHGNSVWAQYSNYIAGPEGSEKGILIEHGIFVETTALRRLHDDITNLTNAVYHEFFSALPNRWHQLKDSKES